jgi:hypothetical protein
MSSTVVDSGKLIPVTLSEEEAVAECRRLGIDYGETALETLIYDTDEYAEVEGLGLCRVENFKTSDPTEDWCDLKKNEDGSYNFRTQYYNGGAHWTELVEEAVKRGFEQCEATKTVLGMTYQCEETGPHTEHMRWSGVHVEPLYWTDDEGSG